MPSSLLLASSSRLAAAVGTAAAATTATRPFGLVEMAVRYNCPWHRTNFTPYYFPFSMRWKLKNSSVDVRKKTYGGRLILMRRILEDKHFLEWNHPSKAPETRLSNPL